MAPLGKIDMSVIEKKKNGNKRLRPRMARPSIDPKQEIIEYNQEKERIEQFFADKDDPHISLIVDITLLNSHPDVIEEIRQAFRRRYLHSPYVLIYMLSSDRNQCGNPTLLDETGLAAFNKALRHRIIIFETADCKNLEPGIDSTIRINQLVSLAKYHQEGSFETCIVTEDKSLVSFAYNLEVACMSYGSLYEELVKYQKYCRKGNSRVVEGNLDWGLLLPEHMYEYPLSYHRYQVGKPSLNSFIDRFADYPDEEDEEGGQEQLEDVPVGFVPSIVVESDSATPAEPDADERPKEEESPSATKDRPKGGAPRKIWYKKEILGAYIQSIRDYQEEALDDYISKTLETEVWNGIWADMDELVMFHNGNGELSKKLSPKTKEIYIKSLGAAMILIVAQKMGFADTKIEKCTDPMARTLHFLSSKSSISPYLDALQNVFLYYYTVRKVENLGTRDLEMINSFAEVALRECKNGAGKSHVVCILYNYQALVRIYNNGCYLFAKAFNMKSTLRWTPKPEKIDPVIWDLQHRGKGDPKSEIDNSYETYGES